MGLSLHSITKEELAFLQRRRMNQKAKRDIEDALNALENAWELFVPIRNLSVFEKNVELSELHQRISLGIQELGERLQEICDAMI